ncbi:MAG: hypothetical protein N3G76_00080 [Candidatus Micrarchaeota archaeon]|nr:hypothetical protein [Candidatus Micrarchaeota archaeon]
MIISRRIEIPRKNVGGEQLLDYIQEYLRANVNGKVLRFAIVDVKGRSLVVDASMRVEGQSTKSRKGNG